MTESNVGINHRQSHLWKQWFAQSRRTRGRSRKAKTRQLMRTPAAVYRSMLTVVEIRGHLSMAMECVSHECTPHSPPRPPHTHLIRWIDGTPYESGITWNHTLSGVHEQVLPSRVFTHVPLCAVVCAAMYF